MHTEKENLHLINAAATDTSKVLVFRSAFTRQLQKFVQEAAWAKTASGVISYVLPAGPYRYPYAAALTLVGMVQSVQPGRTQFANDHALSREALVSALRPLVCQKVIVGIPRLDQLDHESALLFADLLRVSKLCENLEIESGLTVVAGVSEEYPNNAARALLQLSFVQLIDCGSVSPAELPELKHDDRRMLAFLLAAPSPMPLSRLADLMVLDGTALTGTLRSLQELGLAHLSDVAGAGSGLFEFDGLDSYFTQALGILRDSDYERIPEAQLWLQKGNVAALANKLGQRALKHGENRAAINCFRAASKAVSKRNLELELAYGQALARAGSVEGALGIYQEAIELELSPQEDIELGRLAAQLSESGLARYARADKILRRAERGCRGKQLDSEIEIRVLRCQMMIKNGEPARAITLLRRMVMAQLEKVSSGVALDYFLTLARANWLEGRQKQTEKNLARAHDFAKGRRSALRAFKVTLELTNDESCRESSIREATSAAAELCLADDLEPLVSRIGDEWAKPILETAFGVASPKLALQDSLPTSKDFRWLAERGAVLMAGINAKDEVEIFPKSARNMAGIGAWLESSVRRLQEFPDVQLINLHAVPVSGTFSGDMLMTAQEYFGLQHVMVVFRKENVMNIRELLQVMDGH